MSSISIGAAKATYGGETEEETLRNMARECGCRRIYKYANDYGDKKTHTDYFRVEKPEDEERLRSSPHIHNVVLVYDAGDVMGQADSNQDFIFWVAKKEPDDMYLGALVLKMYRENPEQFPAKLVEALETGRVSFRTMWKEEEGRTYVWLQPM